MFGVCGVQCATARAPFYISDCTCSCSIECKAVIMKDFKTNIFDIITNYASWCVIVCRQAESFEKSDIQRLHILHLHDSRVACTLPFLGFRIHKDAKYERFSYRIHGNNFFFLSSSVDLYFQKQLTSWFILKTLFCAFCEKVSFNY